MGKKKDIRAVKGNDSYRRRAGSVVDCIKPEDLINMKDMDIREADTGKLADILEIEIDRNLSDTEKRGNSSDRLETHTSTGRESMLSN